MVRTPRSKLKECIRRCDSSRDKRREREKEGGGNRQTDRQKQRQRKVDTEKVRQRQRDRAREDMKWSGCGVLRPASVNVSHREGLEFNPSSVLYFVF